MNVLFLCHRIPYPPDKGDKIRSFHILRHLAGRHDVSLLCFADDPADLAHEGALAALCRTVDVLPVRRAAAAARAAMAFVTGRPASFAPMSGRRIVTRLRARLAERRYDLAYVFSSAMAPLAESLPPMARIMDLVDVDSEKFVDYARVKGGLPAAILRLEAGRVRSAERRALRSFDRTFVCTERELRLLRSVAGPGPAEVLRNGVELPPDIPSAAERTGETVIFVGSMDYGANVDAAVFAAREIMPRVREARPAATFQIVGRRPAVAVRRLAELPGISVEGAVPSTGAFLARASVALLPLRVARGVANKALEAMAHGVPVVASPAVAESLGATPGVHLETASTPGEYAAAVARFLGDPVARTAVSRAARSFVATEYNWESSFRHLDRVIAEVVPGAAPRIPETAS